MNANQRRSRTGAFIFLFICVHLCSSAAISTEPRFEPQTIDAAISIGYGVDVGDVDGDKKLDILLADQKQFVWYRNPGQSRDRKGAGPLADARGSWTKYTMAANLTEHDNVCITARDIDGDGKVEVAVGAQWNPGETTDPEKSGAIFYLVRPQDPTQKWEPVKIEPHDPTTHRMRWVKLDESKFVLAVLPLHGNENRQGEGAAVRLQLLSPSEGSWASEFIDTEAHLTHNFDIGEFHWGPALFVAGKEGLHTFIRQNEAWQRAMDKQGWD